MGDSLKSEHYLSIANEGIQEQRQQGISNNNLRYFEAVMASIKNEDSQATSLLRQAIQEGFVSFWWAENDPAFDQLRQSPDYLAVNKSLIFV